MSPSRSSDLTASSPPAGEVAAQLAPLLGADRLRLAVPLAPYTTFRIGGPADVVYDATTADELASAVSAARTTGTPFFVLGLGANILIGDGGVRGLVIRNRADAVEVRANGTVRAESGALVGDLIHRTVEAGLGGLEHYIGIPSTVGGAVWQNLHFLSPAPERSRTMFIEEVVRSVELLLPSGQRVTVTGSEMKFGYDTSRLHGSGEIALAVEFALTRAQSGDLHRVMQENLSWRGSRHPWLEHHPSAGSIFKKIEGVGAGRLVDQCGLKGHRVGDAQISHIHANIVVNLGRATARDVRTVIADAQAAVLEKFGQRLEPEIGFVGVFD